MSKSTDKFGAYSDQIYVYSSAKYHAIFFCKKVGNQWKNGVVIIEHQKHVIPTKKKKQEFHQILE